MFRFRAIAVEKRCRDGSTPASGCDIGRERSSSRSLIKMPTHARSYRITRSSPSIRSGHSDTPAKDTLRELP